MSPHRAAEARRRGRGHCRYPRCELGFCISVAVSSEGFEIGRAPEPVPVLLPAGVDGNFNEGSQQVIKHVFLGESGCDLQQSSISNENLEDMFLVLTRSQVSIYCNPLVKTPLLRAAALCPNVHFFCRNKSEFGKDADADERFKASTFVKLTQSIRSIAVPLGVSKASSAVSDEKLRKLIEEWPLVQAYALDGRLSSLLLSGH